MESKMNGNMKPMRLQYIIIYMMLLAGTACTSNQHQNEKAEADVPPNVIVVLTDDQGYGDLGYNGNTMINTPEIDQFASQSVVLSNFHVGTTCAPTRAGLLTGRNANRNNAWHTIGGCSILNERETTIADVFEAQGYNTAMFGKWHLGDNYPYRPHDRGFQEAIYHGGGGVGQSPDGWDNDYFDDTYFKNGKPVSYEGYCTDIWFDQAIQYIKKPRNKPFFVYIAPNAPHGPYNVPEVYAKAYDSTAIEGYQRRFYGMITNIDYNFGLLVNALKASGQFENTILVFTTDNGTAAGVIRWKNGRPQSGYNAGLRGIKGSHYDGGHKVPFFISWPKGGLAGGTKYDALTAHVDLLPTLAELAGIDHTPKLPLDGTSLVSLLNGGKAPDRMLITDTQRMQWPVKGRNSCVMYGHWRLIDGKELYNTAEDVGQKNDVSAQNPEMVKEMQAFYDQWWGSAVTDFRYAYIPIGVKGQDSTDISIHDMHTDDEVPWNQKQIRDLKYKPKGYYAIKVTQPGTYRFALSRYPVSSGLAIGDTVTAIPATPYVDGLPKGKPLLKVAKAAVSIGDEEVTAQATSNHNTAVVEAQLKPGDFKINTYFLTEEGEYFPAYYTRITYVGS